MLQKRIAKVRMGDVEIELRDDAFSSSEGANKDLEREHANSSKKPGKIEDPYFDQEELDEDILLGSV